MQKVKMALLASLTLGFMACGGEASPTEAPSGKTCEATCVDVGFDGGAADEYDHEVNCLCSGDGGQMDESSCESYCSDNGWDNSTAYDVNACQCY